MTGNESDRIADLEKRALRWVLGIAGAIILAAVSNVATAIYIGQWVGAVSTRVAALEKTDAERASHSVEIMRLRTQMEGVPELRLEVRELAREVRTYMNEQRRQDEAPR